ncbi:3-deoxy-D-manno-octulosonic acid transferase [Salinisphaera sp. Q1T1-3]|uniref:3-deoxy-D-manno-octulosonic acid transferase n=1 Tax=Salinisphaera sp. Q1T1-3 TaxID=2321229 RepID=UPI000E730BD8|nr:3-deoxy-D-manno-octulosonic acid transferase [Salinisphaera sp. Q1T1-3]RJS94706.1 3-deoxy-D-manno-octulosonic acid transferase [Salinisphaera sp. Q1T1-3]
MIWRALYALATWTALPAVLLYFAWRGRREPAYRAHWAERLGAIAPRRDRPIWIHAASVGEVNLAISLVRALRAQRTDVPMLLTTMTPTGRATAHRGLPDDVSVGYVPLDTPDATRRFIRRVAPRLGMIIETELWPNLIGAATGQGVPLVLANATLSADSARAYRRWPARRVLAWMLARFDDILAASEADAARFRALGAVHGQVRVAGNIKYDFQPPADLAARARARRCHWAAASRPILVAASTHEGEEARLLDIHRSLTRRYPDLLMILVPRHPQRFDLVADELSRRDIVFARHARGDAVDTRTSVVLGDTLGELLLFYAMADVVFVGGSLITGIGGHNIIEPAALGRVFATGAGVDDWREAIAHFDPAAACIVPDDQTLAVWLSDWLADPVARDEAGADNASRARAHRGALQVCVETVSRRLGVVDDDAAQSRYVDD